MESQRNITGHATDQSATIWLTGGYTSKRFRDAWKRSYGTAQHMAAKAYAASEIVLGLDDETLLNVTVLASVYGLKMLSRDLRQLTIGRNQFLHGYRMSTS
ncbi:hypothetical protein IG631_09175 [Alternaria alternata]|nr:hypothetical protein IG631_09175 [Alternaria alternata]